MTVKVPIGVYWYAWISPEGGDEHPRGDEHFSGHDFNLPMLTTINVHTCTCRQKWYHNQLVYVETSDILDPVCHTITLETDKPSQECPCFRELRLLPEGHTWWGSPPAWHRRKTAETRAKTVYLQRQQTGRWRQKATVNTARRWMEWMGADHHAEGGTHGTRKSELQ